MLFFVRQVRRFRFDPLPISIYSSCALMVFSVVLTGGSASPQIALVAFIFVLAASFRAPLTSVFLFMCSLLLPLSLAVDSIALPGDVRFLGAPLVFVLIARALTSRVRHSPRSPGLVFTTYHPGPGTLVRWALLPIAVLGIASTVWSVDPGKTITSAAALLVAFMFCKAIADAISIDSLVRVVSTFAVLVVSLSVLTLMAFPAFAFAGGRARGIFANSNGLSAFLVVATPVVLARFRGARWLVGIVALGLSIATASRAGSAAVLAELVAFYMARKTVATKALVGISIGVAVLGLLGRAFESTGHFVPTLIVLRTNNSRADTWALGLQYFRENMVLGMGFGAIPGGAIGGLFPVLLATTGIVGSVVAGIVVICMIFSAMRAAPMYAALVAGGIVDTLFEPWLFVGGSLYCVMLWVFLHHPDSHEFEGGVGAKIGGVSREGAPNGPGLNRASGSCGAAISGLPTALHGIATSAHGRSNSQNDA